MRVSYDRFAPKYAYCCQLMARKTNPEARARFAPLSADLLAHPLSRRPFVLAESIELTGSEDRTWWKCVTEVSESVL
jgi:hypothetical protein